jgi:hypothetical protein
MLAGGDMKLPAVPWACYHATPQCALTERTAGVWTNPVKGVKLTVDVVDGEHATCCNHLPAGAGRQFSDVNERYQGHSRSLRSALPVLLQSKPISSQSARQFCKVLGG